MPAPEPDPPQDRARALLCIVLGHSGAIGLDRAPEPLQESPQKERSPMKAGARNQIIGKVKAIKKGSVMCQVTLDVPASQMASVMTLDSLDDMGLREGDQVRVIVKAVNVLLLKD